MAEGDWLAVRFEEQRARLRAVAYRMLGSLAEADDAVQNSWLRLSGTDTAEVQNLSGWLTAVVARECLKMLRARRGRREEPGVHVPEPVISSEGELEPAQRVREVHPFQLTGAAGQDGVRPPRPAACSPGLLRADRDGPARHRGNSPPRPGLAGERSAGPARSR